MALNRIVVPKRLALEPNVVTQNLLVTAIEDERKWFEEEKRDTEPDRASDQVKWDPVDLRKSDTLILSYSRIRTIENLSIMTSLTKLRLDNNEIESIQGLELLVNLRELDLSFNRITRISGLGTLTQLTDLSLYSNKITLVDSLDAQINTLESFSIGRNELKDQRSLVYLRKFPKLRVLCMEGNFKGTDANEYRGSALALLPQIRYLDWTLITDSERKIAQETHHRLVTELSETSVAAPDPIHAALSQTGGAPLELSTTVGAQSMASGIDANIAANAAAVREAGLQYVAYIWRIMMDPKSVADIAGLGSASMASAAAARKAAADGKEGEVTSTARPGFASPTGEQDTDTVLRVPGIPERLETYRDAVASVVEQAVSRGLATHSDMCREVTAADYVLQSYVEASDLQAKRLLDEYGRARKKLLRSAENLGFGHDEAHPHGPAGSEGSPSPAGNLKAEFNLSSPASSHHRHRLGDDDGASENSEIAAAEATLRALEVLKHENEVLHTQLIAIETVLHEQRVAVLTEFDAAYAEIGSRRNELFQKFFRAVEKEALTTAEDAKTITLNAVDNFQEHAALMSAMGTSGSTSSLPHHADASGAEKGAGKARPGGDGEDMDDGLYGTGPGSKQLDDDVVTLLADKESALVAVSNAFDQRIARVLAAEDKTRMNEKDRERYYVKSRLAFESDRHRQRMGEIDAVAARNAADIEAMILVEQHTLAELHGEA